MTSSRRSYWTAVGRAWRLRCPRCGQGKLFAGWIRMNRECAHCHLRFEREPGYFLGSIYVNYGLTAILVTVGYLALVFGGWTSPRAALWFVTAFAILFPVWFFRYARSLWLSFDHYWDPPPSDAATRDATTRDPRG